jgi:hypothetical protein
MLKNENKGVFKVNGPGNKVKKLRLVVVVQFEVS